jgi:hypothetical protein
MLCTRGDMDDETAPSQSPLLRSALDDLQPILALPVVKLETKLLYPSHPSQPEMTANPSDSAPCGGDETLPSQA